MKTIQTLITILFISLLISRCKRGPKSAMIELPKKEVIDPNIDRKLHEVIIREVFTGEKYLYAKAQEGNRKFWISTRKQNIQKGNTYLYNEALLKTQFESREHNRIFDTLYMVTALVPKDHGKNLSRAKSANNPSAEQNTSSKNTETLPKLKKEFAGAINIDELIRNSNKYEGKVVELRGECIKVNGGIMKRNWIHLRDGSKDDFDLVVTTNQSVRKGDVITIRGTVSLNKDFGSGYAYDLLLEEGMVID